MTTLVATPPNLIVNSELINSGFKGFGFFSFTPVGIIVLILGVGYMLIARRWLVDRVVSTGKSGNTIQGLVDRYDLHGKAYRFQIRTGSPLIDKTLIESGLRSRYGVSVIGIERTRKFGQKVVVTPTTTTELRYNDILLVSAPTRDMDLVQFYQEMNLDPLPLRGEFFSDSSRDVGMAEITFSPDSEFLGKTLLQMSFRNSLNVNVVAIRRKGETLEGDLLDVQIGLGDTILVVGDWKAIKHIQANNHIILLNMPIEINEAAPAASQAPYAIASLAVMVVLMVTGIVPNVIAALIGALLMGLFKCLDMESAYKSIHWPSLILIVGMLPFAKALQKTGGIDLAVNGLIGVFGGYSPTVMLICLFMLCAVIGLFISNTATAVLMAPIAIAVAANMNVSPYPFAMIVAIAASAAFITPVSSPVNTLVLAPGGYKFMDYVKIGLPFTIIVMFVSVLIVPLVFPF